MADSKLTNLPDKSVLDGAEELYINDTTDNSDKKITVDQIRNVSTLNIIGQTLPPTVDTSPPGNSVVGITKYTATIDTVLRMWVFMGGSVGAYIWRELNIQEDPSYIWARDFGVHYSNPDNTDALNAALASAKEGQVVVVDEQFEGNELVCTGPIVIGSLHHTGLVNLGGRVLLRFTGNKTGQKCITVGPYQYLRSIQVGGDDNFDGNGDFTGTGIYMNGASQCRIVDVHVSKMAMGMESDRAHDAAINGVRTSNNEIGWAYTGLASNGQKLSDYRSLNDRTSIHFQVAIANWRMDRGILAPAPGVAHSNGTCLFFDGVKVSGGSVNHTLFETKDHNFTGGFWDQISIAGPSGAHQVEGLSIRNNYFGGSHADNHIAVHSRVNTLAVDENMFLQQPQNADVKFTTNNIVGNYIGGNNTTVLRNLNNNINSRDVIIDVAGITKPERIREWKVNKRVNAAISVTIPNGTESAGYFDYQHTWHDGKSTPANEPFATKTTHIETFIPVETGELRTGEPRLISEDAANPTFRIPVYATTAGAGSETITFDCIGYGY